MPSPIALPAVPIAPRTTATAPSASPANGTGSFAERLAARRATTVAPPAIAAPTHTPMALAPGAESITSAGRQLVARLVRGEHALDGVVRQALSGRAYSQADLLALQAQVYQHTQSLDLLSKIAERATSGVKTILQQGA